MYTLFIYGCVPACVHECDHLSIVHLCDKALDYVSLCSGACSAPHALTLAGSVLSGVRPTPAFGRSVCSALGHCGTRLRSAASALSHPQRSLPLWTRPFWRLAALVVLALGHSYICRCACCWACRCPCCRACFCACCHACCCACRCACFCACCCAY